MLTRNVTRNFLIFAIFFLAAELFFSPAALAANVTSSSYQSSTGTYTVQYTFCGNAGSYTTVCWIEESADGGATWSTASGASSGNDQPNRSGWVNFISKPVATYKYRAVQLDYMNPVYVYSSTIDVVVGSGSGVPQQTVSTQLAYGYTVRSGDINADGNPDLYILRTAGGSSGNGVIEKLILQRGANGTFSPIVPNSSQMATASGWNVANVDLELTDINYDGYVDIVLQDLGSVLSGALDQIVVSSGQSGNLNPASVVSRTAAFENFINQTWEFNQDPNYFYANAPIVSVPVYQSVLVCGWDYDYEIGYYEYCYYDYVFVGYQSYYDLSGYDQRAVDLREAFVTVVNGQLTTRLVPGSAQAQLAKAAFQSVFGVDLFRGFLSANCTGGARPYDGEDEFPCDDLEFYGELLLRRLLAIKKFVFGEWRHLTVGEEVLASSEGLSINNVNKVRVYNRAYRFLGVVPALGTVMSPNGNIYIGSPYWMPWREDYSTGIAAGGLPAEYMAVLIHELTHVYQSRTLHWSDLKIARKWAAAHGNYIYYPLIPGQGYFSYNMEQQAEMVSDRFLRRRQLSAAKLGNKDITFAELNAVIPF